MLTGLLTFLSGNLLFLILHASDGGAFPKPLSAKEEKECLEKMAKGDSAARDKLIEHNLRLVSHVVKKYRNSRAENDDLISIGTVGLIKGVSSYRPKKGTRLATYAAKCIDNEILMYFRSLKKRERDVYIDEPLDTDKEGNVLTLSDILCENTDIIDNIDVSIKRERLKALIYGGLDEREREIILQRYGLYGHPERTQNEIAEDMGISRSYVSRIEKKALETLRALYEKPSGKQ